MRQVAYDDKLGPHSLMGCHAPCNGAQNLGSLVLQIPLLHDHYSGKPALLAGDLCQGHFASVNCLLESKFRVGTLGAFS